MDDKLKGNINTTIVAAAIDRSITSNPTCLCARDTLLELNQKNIFRFSYLNLFIDNQTKILFTTLVIVQLLIGLL